MKTKVKEKSLQVLENELDDVFSEYIRLRDQKSGFVYCFVCGNKVPWRQSHNGHFIPRQHMPTRYNEMNCNAVCVDCNCFDKDHQTQYRYAMIARYGRWSVERLEGQKHGLQKFMRFEIQEMIDHYKVQVYKLKKKV